MTYHPHHQLRSTHRLLRSLNQRLEGIDHKLDYVIWRLPESLGTIAPDAPYREPADSLQYDPPDRFIWEND